LVVMGWLEKAAIPPRARAQELGLEAWAQLAQVVVDEVDITKPDENEI